MRNQKYQPIDCNFHDILLDRATKKSRVSLVYEVDGIVCTKAVIIEDVFTKEGEEFLLTSKSDTIRLDAILSIDSEKPPSDTYCRHTKGESK